MSDVEIALACASHSGEERHVALASAMLAKAGRGAAALECGGALAAGEAAARALARSGRAPSALHNNCSGKHAGFVCLACAERLDPKGYVEPCHTVQKAVTEALASMTGTRLGPENRAIDGCSIPTYAIPLRALAQGFARFATGAGLGPERARAAQRIRAAVAANPWAVAGEGRFDTDVMTLLRARVFVKTGAEGVYCAALPELGLGLAVKAEDGGRRAGEIMIAALLARFGGFSDALAPFVTPTLANWRGVTVGALRPAGPRLKAGAKEFAFAASTPGRARARQPRMAAAWAGAPIVFIHGFGADLNGWRLVQLLLPETRPAFAIDLPGHGLTPLGEEASFAALVQAARGALIEEGLH